MLTVISNKQMKRNHIFKSVIVVVLTLIIFSCGNPQSATLQKENETQNQIETVTDEIKGEYYFKYPSGEVEIVNISLDKTYRRKIFKNEADYKQKSAPIYDDKGTWDFYGNKLEFQHWIEYCYMGRIVDSILPIHEKAIMSDVYWYSSIKQTKATLNVSTENGYILKKLE